MNGDRSFSGVMAGEAVIGGNDRSNATEVVDQKRTPGSCLPLLLLSPSRPVALGKFHADKSLRAWRKGVKCLYCGLGLYITPLGVYTSAPPSSVKHHNTFTYASTRITHFREYIG